MGLLRWVASRRARKDAARSTGNAGMWDGRCGPGNLLWRAAPWSRAGSDAGWWAFWPWTQDAHRPPQSPLSSPPYRPCAARRTPAPGAPPPRPASPKGRRGTAVRFCGSALSCSLHPRQKPHLPLYPCARVPGRGAADEQPRALRLLTCRHAASLRRCLRCAYCAMVRMASSSSPACRLLAQRRAPPARRLHSCRPGPDAKT